MRGLFSIATTEPQHLTYWMTNPSNVITKLKIALESAGITTNITENMPGDLVFDRKWFEFEIDFNYIEGKIDCPFSHLIENLLSISGYMVQVSVYNNSGELVPCTKELLENLL